MSKFSWKKTKVNGRDVYQIYIGGHPHGAPVRNEEDANATVQRLEREERQRELDRDSGIEP